MPLKQRPCGFLDFACRKRRSVGDYTTKPKKPKKLRKDNNHIMGKQTRILKIKKQGTLVGLRKPNNNPSTRGKEMKTHK
jgi:hypothetical protein